MKIEKQTVFKIYYKDLSVAIKDEFFDMGKGHMTAFLFWVKAPSSAKEIAAAPHWHELCRTNDIPAGVNVLVEG